MNQRKATVSAILFVLSDKGISYEFNGPVNASDLMTENDRSKTVDMICKGFLEGEVEMSDEGKAKYFTQPTELRKYVVGLVNNWLRKAPELNGGQKYQVKNPGSRAGSGNETIKALKQLLTITDDQDARRAIEAEIASQLETIKPKVEINFDAIPAHLRHLLDR
jgi:hypothetical protein